MLLLKSSRWRYLAMLSIAWLVLFTLTRVALLCASFSAADVNIWQLFLLFSQGAIYDLGFLSFVSLPLAMYLTLCPQWLWVKKGINYFYKDCLP